MAKGKVVVQYELASENEVAMQAIVIDVDERQMGDGHHGFGVGAGP